MLCILCIIQSLEPCDGGSMPLTLRSQVRVLHKAWTLFYHTHKITEALLEPRSLQAQAQFLRLPFISSEEVSLSFAMPSRQHGVSETKPENVVGTVPRAATCQMSLGCNLRRSVWFPKSLHQGRLTSKNTRKVQHQVLHVVYL